MLLKSSHNYRLGGQLILLIVSSNMSCPLDWLDDDDGGGCRPPNEEDKS